MTKTCPRVRQRRICFYKNGETIKSKVSIFPMRRIICTILAGWVLVAECESRSVVYESLGPGGDYEGTQYITFFFTGVPVTSGMSENRNAALSPDNTLMVYQSSVENNRYNIYAMNLITLAQGNLSNSLVNDVLPVFSPDGTKIAFFRSDGTSDYVYIMDVNGDNQRKISKTPVIAEDRIRFTGDGRNVIVTSIDNGVYNISSVAVDGSSQTILTAGLGGFNAQISPFSDRVVFVSGAAYFQNIYTMQSSGIGIHQVTTFSGTYFDPVFFPDEQRIVYSEYVSSGYCNIYEISVNGDSLRRLTYSNSVDATPVFTPDGKWIAFNRLVNNNWDICFISVDRRYEVNFTNTPFTTELFPVFCTWMQTSVMYFQSNYTGYLHIWSSPLTELYALRK